MKKFHLDWKGDFLRFHSNYFQFASGDWRILLAAATRPSEGQLRQLYELRDNNSDEQLFVQRSLWDQIWGADKSSEIIWTLANAENLLSVKLLLDIFELQPISI